MLHTHIAFLRKFYISGMLSGVFLAILSTLAIFPVANSFSGAEAAAVISETTLAMTTSDINLPLSITNPNGSFVAGDPADFTVTTNNYSGYTLSVSAKTDDENYSKLVNGNDVFNSISSATDATGFNNGNWGYLPSKLNSSANTSYQPAPTFAGDTLDVTAAANNEANTYSIALGAKADYSLPAGKYSNTFVITAIANPVAYAISYDANTDDPTVANIPDDQHSEITTASVELSSNVPTRTGYTFTNWCDGTVTTIVGADACTGTTYAPGDPYGIDQTGTNIVTMKAMWATTMPKAVLGANGNLNFVYDDIAYDAGKTYTDNLGETTVSAVYEVPAAVSGYSDRPGWADNNTITSVNFTPNFYSFKPTSTASWFYGDSYIASVTNAEYLNMSEVLDMTAMFYDAGYNASSWSIDVGAWDISKVENMKSVFASAGKNATYWDIDGLENWNTASVNNMYAMFQSTGQKASDYVLDLSSWNVSNVTDISYMFQSAGQSATNFSIKLNNWKLNSSQNVKMMFDSAATKSASITLELDNWEFGSGTNAENMFSSFGENTTSNIALDLSSWDVSNISRTDYMFSYLGEGDYRNGNVPNVDLNLSGWTVNANNFHNMFLGIANYTNHFTLDVSDWTITSNPQYLYPMFYQIATNGLDTEVDCSGWNLPNVTSIDTLFIRLNNGGKGDLKLDMSNLNAPNLTSIKELFSYAGAMKDGDVVFNLSNWTTPKLNNMSKMFDDAFKYAGSLSIIGLNTINTSNVTDMSNMFYDVMYFSTAPFSIDVSAWNVSNVLNMQEMFASSGSKSSSWSVGDLSSWNVSKVTNMSGMFEFAGKEATTWSIGDISSWTPTSATSMSSMFYNAGLNASYSLDLSSWSVPLVTNYAGFNTGVETKVIPPVWNN